MQIFAQRQIFKLNQTQLIKQIYGRKLLQKLHQILLQKYILLKLLAHYIIVQLFEFMNQNSQYVKKGVFTSREKGEVRQNSSKKQYVEEKKDVVTSHYESKAGHVTVNRPHITIQQLNETKYANSQGYNIQPHIIHQNVQQPYFVPPPPSRFLVSSNSIGQTSNLPINSTHLTNSVQGHYYIQPQQHIIHAMPPVQTIQTVPVYQNIKKTFIPHHIYNQIPIMNSETKRYEQSYQNINEEQVNTDADEKMMHQYQKLYQIYLQEKTKSQRLQRRLSEMQHQFRNRSDGPPKQIIKEVIKTKEVFVNKAVKVDQKLLLALIMKKFKFSLGQFFERKKSSCLNKLKNIMKENQSQFKTIITKSTQQFSSSIRLRNH